ncbi:MAG: hypothetical protein JW828_07675 [Sedimentisphaerales bacterium]|nr:hypothetical protein [Sedimentisphaerales bacterium]
MINPVSPVHRVNNRVFATFDYDALGRRIRKVDSVASETTLYYYNPDWQCLEERDGSDVLQRSFTGRRCDPETGRG